MRKALRFFLVGLMVAGIAGCGGGSSGSETGSGSGALSSLSDLPDLDTMVSGGSTAITDLNDLMIKAVSGASGAPILREISSTVAKTWFWKSGGSNLVDIVGSSVFGDLSDEQKNGFWLGEGSCRMAQMVGYAMQNIKQAGTSMCYMKNMPSVLGADNVTVSTGSAPITDVNAFFDNQASDFIVRVNATGAPAGEEGQSGDMIVYIKVYGTSSLADANDYNVDLWFCANTSASANGFEQIRYDDSASTVTKSNVETSFGTFGLNFSAQVTTDSNGDPIFDTSADRSATVMFAGSFDGQSFVERANVTVSGDLLSAKSYSNNITGSSTRKNFAVAQYSGDDMSELRFLQAAYKGTDVGNGWSNEYNGGTEFQDDHYEGIDLISDISDADIVSAANAVDLATDSFFTGDAPVAGDIDTASLANYPCNPTVNYTAEMDFTNEAVAAVSALCENDFSEMQFCDAEAIQAARQVLFEGYMSE